MNNNNFNTNKRLIKLETENTAFNDCSFDMSDVRFEIGKNSYTAQIFGMIAIFGISFGSRILTRRIIANPDFNLSKMNMLFWGLIALLIIFVIVSFITQNRKPIIFVEGKILFYGGNDWTSDEISCVKCTKFFETIKVYSNGKKILSFSWERDNSELFIAWAKKCGIVFEDNRMKLF